MCGLIINYFTEDNMDFPGFCFVAQSLKYLKFKINSIQSVTVSWKSKIFQRTRDALQNWKKLSKVQSPFQRPVHCLQYAIFVRNFLWQRLLKLIKNIKEKYAEVLGEVNKFRIYLILQIFCDISTQMYEAFNYTPRRRARPLSILEENLETL